MKKRSNGEGTIYAQKKDNKIIRWIGQITINGKRKSVYGKTQKEVKDKLKQIQSNIYNHKYCEKSYVTFYQLGTELIEKKLNANIIKEVTYLRNLETLNICKSLWYYEIQDITPTILQDFLNSLTNYSQSTIDKTYMIIGQILKEAIAQKIIYENPLNRVIKPKSIKKSKVVDAFTIEEQKEIINALEGETYKNVFLIGFNTGMRIGEILALTIDDIDFKNMVIRINKTSTLNKDKKRVIGESTKTYTSTREIPITTPLKSVLRETISNYTWNKNRLLFTLPNGNIIENSTINAQLKRICKNLGIRTRKKIIIRENKKINSYTSDVNTHMIRHTYATRCIESGMPAVVLQKLLGHKDVSVTLNTYTSVFNSFKEDTLNVYLDYMNKIMN